ncbi:Hypothetical protein DEACI_2596 [Acididesulfobacillus acetoxydans]|uniref:Uncharacterized protein n=1 Tax=Acididesulfobacillus acetoxydans TaxID=1561005 RepID=A0A8S0Y3C1_9FIRM|nr:hypothetical protein [Acididesulfobacillus acetoxydans]CAA7601925.1 Hypothetical protein DEACI_2596 [Acididesulfobacillus acetoxydans]CEJ08231.1 Hypothetical protein DEACI_2706 [Acididesulfobacillus acetoxydans]
MYTKNSVQLSYACITIEGKVASMFLVTWIEGEEVKYRLVNDVEVLRPLVFSLGQHVIVQALEP